MELNWSNARAWEEEANKGKQIFNEPKWSWDCNFKLDFDGALLTVSSRLYPPHKNVSNWWKGSVKINLLDKEILQKEFKCSTLNQLKEEVELFTNQYTEKAKIALMQIKI